MTIELDSIIKRFPGTPAVDGVTVTIDDDEFFVMLGPPGCGKSTLLRRIHRLDFQPGHGWVDFAVARDVAAQEI